MFLYQKKNNSEQHFLLGGRRGPAAFSCTLGGEKRQRNQWWGNEGFHADLLRQSTELLAVSVSSWWSLSVPGYTEVICGTFAVPNCFNCNLDIIYSCCYLNFILNKWNQVIDLIIVTGAAVGRGSTALGCFDFFVCTSPLVRNIIGGVCYSHFEISHWVLKIT